MFPLRYVQSQANSLQGKIYLSNAGFPALGNMPPEFAFRRSAGCDERELVRTQAGYSMVARRWTKSLAKMALLMIAGAGTLCCAQRPAGTGSLSGKLTDVHSSPLENMTVTLRNAVTGNAMQTTTAHEGRYRFNALAQGEYTLTATGPCGSGHVDGIYVAGGHESQIQTAIVLNPPEQHVTVSPRIRETLASVTESPARQLPAAPKLKLPSSRIVDPITIVAVASLTPETFALLPLNGAKMIEPKVSLTPSSISEAGQPLSNSLAKSTSSISAFSRLLPSLDAAVEIPTNAIPVIATSDISDGAIAEPTLVVGLVPLPASLLSAQPPKAQLAAIANSVMAQPSQSLDSAQLQALPLPGRNWQNFLLDTPATPTSAGDEQRNPARAGTLSEITVDGQRVQPAFNTRNGTSFLMNPATSEIAIREVQTMEAGGAAFADLGRTNVETQHGTERLHGQAFAFDRQNLWGAQNPFTQRVQETAPASHSTIPVFTPEPYTPCDRELLWGAGVGGEIHKRRLFWFAALDGYERNNPGVSTVKHPDNFFAQPSNDQMQLLSAQLGLNGADPVSAGLGAYSPLLQSLAGLLGPASRMSSQWTGFGRFDWSMAERHHFTAEVTAAQLDSPGGGFTRVSETYGTHSFGGAHATAQWVLGKWEAFLTPNLLAVTQGSFGHQVQSAPAETPSTFEQSLNINAWGQLPQIVVDSGYGFTIGNPARFGSGYYPDEHLYKALEELNWVRGKLMMKAGFEISHNADATSQLRNQTGTYDYSTVEDFASDALAFSSFGLNGQLDPMNQHNCDQTGKAWRDSSGVLHGLGYLPCYSYYSQTMGPSDWWLSTNDWAGFLTSQWQPAKRTAVTLAMRWELEQLAAADVGFAES